MNFIKILLVLAVIGFGYHYWQRHHTNSVSNVAMPSPNGFVALPTPANTNSKDLIIFSAENCPKEDARRANELADQLSRRNIPFTRSHHADFDFPNPDPEVLDRLNAVMNGKVPIVFMNGKGKANPTIDEVVAEYNANK